MPRRLALLVLLALLALGGCKAGYYSLMETFGQEKRDILVKRVVAARDSQEKAREQFKDSLEKFQSVVQVEGGELERRYNQLQSEYERSQGRARDVSGRIAKVKEVSADLFNEWQRELGQYKNAELRRQSERDLRDTQRRYDQLMDAMERAEATMYPVLDAFGEQVLFLKHNLNARAIASLQGEAAGLQDDIDRLIADMNRSIDEANAFIRQMGIDRE